MNLRLPGGRVHDYRLLLQKNKKGEWEVTGCAGRIGPTHSITSNLHGGGMAVPMEKLLLTRLQSLREINRIKHNMSRISTQVAIFLEGRFGTICELGIDLAVDERGKVWLLEVNPKPSREVFRKIGDMDTYRKAITNPLEFAIWLMEQPKASVHLLFRMRKQNPYLKITIMKKRVSIIRKLRLKRCRMKK
ncbi:YheC/YheD family protein [Paenibacillus larvae]|nr:YheC/YheD family protein [Paenibacillus larvae]MDT2294301.1 YheC/YheD family protein [Paenibacillus larvae]